MSDVDNLQKIFSDATNKMKVRVGQLEYEVKEKKAKIEELSEEIVSLEESVKDANEGVDLWKKTSENRQQFLEDYQTREQDAFGTVIHAVVQYMDDYELYKDVSNKYAGAILQGFKGLKPAQKIKYTEYVKKKTTETINYVKRMKEGKI